MVRQQEWIPPAAAALQIGATRPAMYSQALQAAVQVRQSCHRSVIRSNGKGGEELLLCCTPRPGQLSGLPRCSWCQHCQHRLVTRGSSSTSSRRGLRGSSSLAGGSTGSISSQCRSRLLNGDLWRLCNNVRVAVTVNGTLLWSQFGCNVFGSFLRQGRKRKVNRSHDAARWYRQDASQHERKKQQISN